MASISSIILLAHALQLQDNFLMPLFLSLFFRYLCLKPDKSKDDK